MSWRILINVWNMDVLESEDFKTCLSQLSGDDKNELLFDFMLYLTSGIKPDYPDGSALCKAWVIVERRTK